MSACHSLTMLFPASTARDGAGAGALTSSSRRSLRALLGEDLEPVNDVSRPDEVTLLFHWNSQQIFLSVVLAVTFLFFFPSHLLHSHQLN